MELFSLEKYLRQSGTTKFEMNIVHSDEVSVELEITNELDKGPFRCYIEKSVILPKLPADKLRELFGGLNKSKFTSKKNWRTTKTPEFPAQG